ncbi:hypothetical protein BpHYR1_005554 [Brachionus plicatilis]|uniref:Uncharacterized protein n=1 Tax=Brachionus plicatilis TaxID=10195 RepID=A0A3M7SGY1_BRAPC|nr:hypothetical protein BpHYR1_005554 [Brachionus plicatilis]
MSSYEAILDEPIQENDANDIAEMSDFETMRKFKKDKLTNEFKNFDFIGILDDQLKNQQILIIKTGFKLKKSKLMRWLTRRNKKGIQTKNQIPSEKKLTKFQASIIENKE